MNQKHLYRTVAALHIANINQGFLATLGVGFVSLMYRAIDEGDTSVLLVAHVDGGAVGFVAGATGMLPIYKRMLHYWPQLIWALLPSLFLPQRVWRIIEILRYSRGSGKTTGAELPAAELLSIAVAPAYRGNHHAEELYKKLCQHFLGQGLPAFKIVVGSVLTPAHKFYGRMGAQAAGEIKLHGGSISTIYVQTLPWAPLSPTNSNGSF